MEWSEREEKIKPKRGRRMALMVSNVATYAQVREKAAEKWRAYHSDCYKEEAEYVLLYENGNEAQFLPGPDTEFFSLKRYKEELGKEYNRICLYLCTKEDYYASINLTPIVVDDELENVDLDVPKKARYDDVCLPLDEQFPMALGNIENFFKQENPLQTNDEALARQLHAELNNACPEEDIKASVEESFASTESVLKSLEAKVGTDHFFIIIRRGSPLQRKLSLWQREAKKVSPERLLRVHFVGESGIDSGALAKEFFAQIMPDIAKSLFPGGSPADSVYNVQNGSLKTCGQIIACSLTQGGAPPKFLHENVFNLMVCPEVDINNLSLEDHFTEIDRQLIESVRSDVCVHQDVILDHGYTGMIDSAHVEEIVGTLMVSILTRRQLYLKAFMEGMQLFKLLR